MHTKQPIAKKLKVPVAAVWEAVSGIGGLEVWFPIIETCVVEGRGAGAIRRMALINGGGEIQDSIEEVDIAARKLVYQRPVSPFPVTYYRGTVEVFESYDGLGVVVWTIDFESAAEDAQSVADIVKGAIGDGVDGMEKDLLSRDHRGIP